MMSACSRLALFVLWSVYTTCIYRLMIVIVNMCIVLVIRPTTREAAR